MLSFRTFWLTLNSATNLIAWSLIVTGAVLIFKGHGAEGGGIVTGAFALLTNGSKHEVPAVSVQAPPDGNPFPPPVRPPS